MSGKLVAMVVVLLVLVGVPVGWFTWHQRSVDTLNAQRAACIRISEANGSGYYWSPETGCMTRHWDGSLTPLPIDASEIQDGGPVPDPQVTPDVQVTCINGRIVQWLGDCGDNEHPGQDQEASASDGP